MQSGITVQNLTKRFGPVTAVDDLTFDVPTGKVTAFLGPNGAGKTTTLRMILGLVAPSSGRALVEGADYRDLPEPRKVVGAAIEAMAAHPGRRARHHLMTVALASGVRAERLDEVLEQVGLSGAQHRRAGGFSLGMRQRLGLAAALLTDPRVLILDEPANGLDPAGTAWMRELLIGLAAGGRTVMVSSHVLSEVAQTADHVVIITSGRLRYAGPLADLGPDARALESAFLTHTT